MLSTAFWLGVMMIFIHYACDVKIFHKRTWKSAWIATGKASLGWWLFLMVIQLVTLLPAL